MRRPNLQNLLILVLFIAAPCARTTGATTVQELVRIKGHERNTLVGMGIVIGLNGTGDQSKDSLVAARPYQQLLSNLGNPIAAVEELAEADAYALVQVTLEVPAAGVRSGDRLNVTVSTLFNATSLAGGELVMSPLRLPLPGAGTMPPMAFANGPLAPMGDNPRRAIVRNGGQMMTDVRTNPLGPGGTLSLVVKDQYAGFTVTTMIANALNEEFALDGYERVAAVEDAKNIRVELPPAMRRDPAAFIAAVLMVPIDASLIRTGARVVINESRGIILVTGDVEIGPVLITHKDLSITSITPEPPPTLDQPAVRTTRWTSMDTTAVDDQRTTRLADLLRAFDQLDVDVSDQIAIVHELKKTGRLHAEIVTE